MFILLNLTIAKGRKISRAKLKKKTKIYQSVATIIFSMCYAAAYIYELKGRDEAATYYKYENTPGILLVVMRVLVLFWFLWCVRRSYRQEAQEDKKHFYFLYGSIYGLWFFSFPFVIFVGSLLDPYHRLKTVTAMLYVVDAVAIALMAVLTNPTRLQGVGSTTITKMSTIFVQSSAGETRREQTEMGGFGPTQRASFGNTGTAF